jgi:hypothetical protein
MRGMNFHEFINPPAGQKVFFKNYGLPTPLNPDTSLRWSLKTPDQHGSIMMSQRKSGGHMDMPSPGMIRNLGAHFD